MTATKLRFPAGAVLVKWTAEWCGPCIALKKAKTLERVAVELGLAFEIRDVESPEFAALSDKKSISVLPTVQVLSRAGRTLATFEGAASFNNYVTYFRKTLTETPQKRTSKAN